MTTDRIDVTLERVRVASRARIAVIVTNETSRTLRGVSAEFAYRTGDQSGGALILWECHGNRYIDMAPGDIAKFITLGADREMQSFAASLSTDHYFVQFDHCRGEKREELLRIPGAIIGEFLANTDIN